LSGAAPRTLAVIESGRLRVCFDLAAGRIRHSIWAVDGGPAELLLTSVDGLTGADEFSTPVLTELQMPPSGEAQSTVLAVGAAARGHWSLSAVADAVSGRIEFDVACRVQAPRGPLGVAYLSNVPLSLNSQTQGISLAHRSAGRFQLDIVAGDSSAPNGGWQIRPDGRIERALSPPSTSACTLRWHYVVTSSAEDTG